MIFHQTDIEKHKQINLILFLLYQNNALIAFHIMNNKKYELIINMVNHQLKVDHNYFNRVIPSTCLLKINKIL